MNPQDPLAALQPLRDPQVISWWPLAPGWWLLALLVMALLSAAAYVLVKRYRANAYRREALAQLGLMHTRYQAERDLQRFAADTNALLKSAALVAYPEHEIAARHGAEWARFLNQCGAGALFDESSMEALYSPELEQVDAQQLYNSASNWLSEHRVPT